MGLLEYIFPQSIKCIFCGREVGLYAICDECKRALPFIPEDACVKCGGRVSGMENICIDCKAEDRAFEKCFCILDYDGDVRNKILKFKSKKYKNIGNAFAHLIYEKFEKINIPFDIIIPVPIHENRKRQRGFNQSEILCTEIKKYYGRVNVDAMIRKLDTPRQAGLNRDNRQENLDGAFKVVNKSKIKGKIVLVVDDIFTTGVTLNECAKALLKAGASKVYGLCLSRAVLNWDSILYE